MQVLTKTPATSSSQHGACVSQHTACRGVHTSVVRRAACYSKLHTWQRLAAICGIPKRPFRTQLKRPCVVH